MVESSVLILEQTLGYALPQFPAAIVILNPGKQSCRFKCYAGSCYSQIALPQRPMQISCEFQRLSGVPEKRDLPTDEAGVTTELEQPWFAAVPATLELNSDKVMAIVEARGDQEQGFEVCVTFKRMMFDKVFEIFVLIGVEMPCERFKNTSIVVSGSLPGEMLS